MARKLQPRKPVVERIHKLKCCLNKQELDGILKKLTVPQMELVEKLIKESNKPLEQAKSHGYGYDPIHITVNETGY